MTSSASISTDLTPARDRDTLRHWAATGLFCLMFTFSGVWYVVDPEGARASFRFLGFPTYFVYPVAAAKLLGVATILLARWRTLTLFAFAGFLFDLLLALSAHIANDDPAGWLAGFGLLAWLGAFWVDRRRFGPGH